MKKRIAAQILILFFTFVLAIGLVFAFYIEKQGAWEQEISTTTIVFKVNNKSVNTISNETLKLIGKGDEADFVVTTEVSSTSNVAVLADYTIDFSLSGIDNELARAIEVYEYKDGKYRYVSMLNGFTEISGIIPINTSETKTYKLVYSSAAGEYYEDKGFTLQLQGYTDLFFNETDIHYIRSYAALQDAVQNSERFAGQTFVLLNNIAIPDDTNLTLTEKIGLDFNGYTLTIGENSTLGISYAGSNSANDKLGVYNSIPNQGGLAGNGILEISCPDDFMYIQDDLSLHFASINVTSYSLAKISDILQSKSDELRTKVFSLGSEVDFAENLHYYIDAGNASGRLSFGLSAIAANILEFDGIENVYRVKNSFVNPMTSLNALSVSVYKGGQQENLELMLTVLGTSSNAVAANLLTLVPPTVEGSIFLPNYDETSKSTITWVVENSKLITKNGSYISEGYDVLDSWVDQPMKIGVIVDIAGEQFFEEKTIIVQVMTAEERTEQIYGFENIALEEIDSYLQFYNHYVDSAKAQKAGLIGIDMSVNNAMNTMANGNNYVEIVSSGAFDDLHLINKPSADKSVEIDVDITFIYENPVSNLSYTISDKLVNIIGYREAVDISDPTPILQRGFNSNDYILTGDFDFTVDAALSDGQFVDYFVDPAFIDKLLIENDVFVESGAGLFVLDNGEYRFATAEDSGTLYNRVARFRLLPAMLPSYDIEIPITAKLWEEKVAGSKVYLKDDGGIDLVYYLSLVAEGIYHNIPTEIADFNLYTALLSYFDKNSDGWIQVGEAQCEWNNTNLARIMNTRTINGIEYNYIDLSGLSVESLKGLEYFTDALGFDLSDNRIKNISELSTAFTLKYLDLGNNLIANTEALQFLDNIEILYLNNNAITDISPIRYLGGVKTLDLSYNDSLSEFSPLTYYSSLKSLDITQTTADNVNTENVVYDLALIGANNDNVVINRIAAEGQWVAAPEQIIAAKALSEMISIYEAYNTLYIPTTYYYEYTVDSTVYRDTYNIQWSTLTSEDSAYLVFTTDGSGNTNGYQIVSPIVDRNIAVAVKVTKTTSSNVTFTLSRNINIKLLQSQDSSAQLFIETATGVFTPAEQVVPDPILRNLLFRDFNTTTAGTVTIGGTARSERYILNETEMETVALSTVDWHNKGITDLTGLRYFAGCFNNANLYLQGNPFIDSDISELAYLNGISGLYLSGQEYDFDSLVPTAVGAARLTSLDNLVVYGCYNLDDENVLAGLYRVYLTNTSSKIYIENNTLAAGTEWDPYEIILPRYSQSLPMSMTFIDVGQEHYYFNDAEHFYTFDFYNVLNIDFRILAPTSDYFQGFFSGKFSNILETVNSVDYVVGVRYDSLVGYSDTVYAKVMLQGNDGRSNLSVSHFTLLKCEFNYKILVTDYSQGADTSLDKIFPGRSLRSSVMGKITTLINTPALAAASKNTIGSGFYQEGSRYYITMASLMALSYGGSEELEIDGSFSNGENAIQGLQYIPLKKVLLRRDGRLGTGEYLQGLTALTIINSGVDLSNIDRDIPNLKELYIGQQAQENRFCILYEESNYYLSHFTGLTTVFILNSNIYDWTGLNGLIGLDIATLKIFSSGETFRNRNNITNACVDIVEQIYNASDATTKNYYIGAPENDRDSYYLYTPGTWTIPSGVASYSTSADTELEELLADGDINGLGLRLDGTSYTTGTLYYLSKTKEPTSSIYLPKSTYHFFYGTTYSSNSDMMTRDFAITWKIHGISATQFEALFGQSIGYTVDTDYLMDTCLILTDREDITLSYSQPQYDCMFYIEGVIGNGYYSGYDGSGNYLGTTYTTMDGSLTKGFLFPMFIRGSDTTGAPTGYTSYRIFSDTVFRFAMFVGMTRVNGNYDGTGRMITSYLTSTTILEINQSRIKICSTAYSSASMYLRYANISEGTIYESENAANTATLDATKGGIGSLVEWRNYTGSVYSLDGVSSMTSLATLSIGDAFLKDISDLNNSPSNKLTSLNISDNMVSDISALNHFTRLVNVTLNRNPIVSLENGTTGYSVLQNSSGTLRQLLLESCRAIDSSDLDLLYAGNAFTAMTTLNLNSTNCYYDFNTYLALQDIINNTTAGTLTVYLNDVNSALTLAEINAFITDCTTGPVLSTYLYSTGIDNNTNLTTMVVNGQTYTLSLLNSTYLTNNSYLNTTGYKTTLRVDGTVNNLVLTADFLVDYNYSGGSNFIIQYVDASSNTISLNGSDFDPAIWAYLVKRHTSYAGNTLTVPRDSLSSINITEDIGITSLKGLNKINCLTQLSISGNRNITELWTGDFPSLLKFGLRDVAKLDAQDCAVLGGCSALTHMDLYMCYGIDYLENITYNSTTTTFADVLCGISTLKYISINNERHMDLFVTGSTKNIFAAFLGYLGSSMANNFLQKTNTGTAIAEQTVYSIYTNDEKRLIRVDDVALALTFSTGYVNAYKGKRGSATIWSRSHINTSYPLDVALYDELLNRDTGLDSDTDNESIFRPILPDTIYESNIMSTGVYFYFPKTIWYLDREYSINWTVVNANKTSTNLKSICMNENYNGGVRFYLDSTNFNNASMDGVVKLRIRADLVCCSTTKRYDYNLNITRSATTAVTPSSRLPLYYFELENLDPIVLTPGNDIITSPAFLQWLFNDYTSPIGNSNAFKETPSGDGWYMTYEGMQAVTELSLAHKGITTIEGIQHFVNLTSLYIDRGAVISLEPLSSMQLTRFAYDNSIGATDNIIVQDFSPLLASKDTLVTFQYLGYSNVNIEDLSFLMSFGEQLTGIYLIAYYYSASFSPYYSEGYAYNEPYYLGYLETTGFQYLVSWFELNRPNTSIYIRNLVNNSLIDHIELTNSDKSAFFKFTTSVDQKEAAYIMSQINTDGSDVVYYNNYELVAADYSNDGGNDVLGIKLPADINIGGQSYIIEWTEMSGFLDVTALTFYGVAGKEYSFSISDGTITLRSGDTLTLAQAQEIRNSVSYQNYAFSGECSIYTTVSASDITANQIGNFYIVARIRVGDYDYDRVFNLVFNDTFLQNIYLVKLDALLVAKNNLYQNQRYTLANITSIRNIIAQARSDIQNATNVDEFISIYGISLASVSLVPESYSVTYYDLSNNVYGTTVFIEAGTTYTLLSKPASFSANTIRWSINDQRYAYGGTITMPAEDISIYPWIPDIKYYLVKDSVTTIAEAEAEGYEFRSLSVNYSYHIKNMQFSFQTGLRNTRGDYKIVSTFTDELVTVVSAVTFASGNFDLDLTITDYVSLNVGTLETSQNHLYYTLMGQKDNLGSSAINWFKPDHRYPLTYDEDLDLYYIQMSWSGATYWSTSLKLKFVAVIPERAALAGKNAFSDTIEGNVISHSTLGTSSANIEFTATQNQIYTFYLDYRDSCYVLNGEYPLIANEAGLTTREGFSVTAGDEYAYFSGGTSGTGGVLVLAGDFESTKDSVAAFRD